MKTRFLILLASIALLAAPAFGTDGAYKATTTVDESSNVPAVFRSLVVVDPITGKRAYEPYFVIGGTLPAGANVIGGVTIADGSAATLGAKADAKSTATDTTAITVMQVLKEISAMEQAPPSRAVTNAGTFATQAAQKQYTGTPSNFAIGSTDATVFTLAAGEVGFIQNLSADAPLAVKKGASGSSSSLNFILAACTADADGTGGAVRIDDWVGAVSVAKMAGTAKYIAWKQAP